MHTNKNQKLKLQSENLPSCPASLHLFASLVASTGSRFRDSFIQAQPPATSWTSINLIEGLNCMENSLRKQCSLYGYDVVCAMVVTQNLFLGPVKSEIQRTEGAAALAGLHIFSYNCFPFFLSSLEFQFGSFYCIPDIGPNGTQTSSKVFS